MYHVSAQGVDERMINVHYYHYHYYWTIHLVLHTTSLCILISRFDVLFYFYFECEMCASRAHFRKGALRHHYYIFVYIVIKLFIYSVIHYQLNLTCLVRPLVTVMVNCLLNLPYLVKNTHQIFAFYADPYFCLLIRLCAISLPTKCFRF